MEASVSSTNGAEETDYTCVEELNWSPVSYSLHRSFKMGQTINKILETGSRHTGKRLLNRT